MRFNNARAFSLVIGLLSFAASGTARATYQHLARTTSDVCANIDLELAVDVLGIKVIVGLLDICLCLSAIPDLCNSKSNPVVASAVGLVGVASVEATLTDTVNTAAGHETCTYPDNCDPLCSAGNPCGFQCKNGFVPSPASHPTQCICPAPNKVCNGICGSYKSCPSSGPKKREDLERRAVCGAELTACGVYGFGNFNAWECVDTKSDLESCGGCMVPFGRNLARGVDCTGIPGVMDVTCVSGSCVIRRCQPGYVVSLDNTFCLQTETLTRLQAEAGDEPAALYGLEHVPLQKKSA
ncbi:uncharacterized protein PHACADRAFT_248159 [Phanerochaete carnosa HHB-10118-sp]|uniref:Protein CPL1-like domain-containing protein n=1 Tax=Phanerochaete carnosa (strain HHB-10118-sp) TaxID=650164 RepID=K5VEP6_PHACS|nr:uncharacterized protein PHACADRAFT_248159 [Phanerochaete carnosa HHB-10118-sp]EKM61501.1 hypothetical protein PHACADRAFT_248159 [Phanerochaete carnosa HHB-10118-sp]